MIFVRPKLFDHAMHLRESLRSFDKQDINSFNPRRGSLVFPVESLGGHKKGFRIKMTVIGPLDHLKSKCFINILRGTFTNCPFASTSNYTPEVEKKCIRGK